MNFENLENIKELLKKYDGNCSLLYPRIKDKIEKMDYEQEEVPYMMEFLCFENDYFLVKEFMLENNIEREVVDIGCQYGFQSELFLKQGYTGIDVCRYRFLNEKSAKYIVREFPKEIDINLKNKFVISNMSLSWFDNSMEDKEIIEKLAQAEFLYFRGRVAWKKELEKHYKNSKILNKTKEPLINEDFDGVIYWK